MHPKAYWVGLNMVRGIGAVRMRTLLDHFGEAQFAWEAPPDTLRAIGLHPRIVDNLLQMRREIDLERCWQQIETFGIHVLTWDEEAYPVRLKEIDQPPPVLYVRGELQIADEWAVAIVGTRRVTAYGRQVTEELAGTLARQGVTVVSGLARGVDSIAHDAALKAGGRTLAVLACGLERIYPPEHRRLAEQIMSQGALVGDYAPGTPPDSANFPPRNRIISGLAQATVVVEAGETSGALITAAFAADQGREVFAVPGNIYAPQSKGSNRLIQQGARPLLAVDEVLEALNLEQVQSYVQARLALPVDEVERKLLEVLSQQPLHVDEIRVQTSLPVEKVSATLTLMELKGMVRMVGASNYVAVREVQQDYRTE